MLSDSETRQDANLGSTLYLEDVLNDRPILYQGRVHSQRSSTIAFAWVLWSSYLGLSSLVYRGVSMREMYWLSELNIFTVKKIARLVDFAKLRKFFRENISNIIGTFNSLTWQPKNVAMMKYPLPGKPSLDSDSGAQGPLCHSSDEDKTA
jgi:hypothetical protein